MARGSRESKSDGASQVRIAGSLEEAGQNDVLYVNGKGEVLSPLRYWVSFAFYLWALAVLCGALAILLALTAGPLGLLFAALVSGWAFLAVLMGLRVRRGILLLAGGRVERSLEVLGGVARSRLTLGATRGIAEQGMAMGLAVLGRHEEALAHSRAALARFGARTRDSNSKVYRELSRHGEITMLANLGQLGAAKALFAALGPAPEGEYLRVHHFTTELYLAFLEGSLAMDEDALYERARMGLSITTAAALLALAAWAYEKRGDREMFEHLLRPALERAPGRKLGGPMPGLAAWMRERGEALEKKGE